MKKIKQLQLRKKVIANLTDDNKSNIFGGKMQVNEAMFTTSFVNCTDFLCCEPGPTTSKTIVTP
ncbi:class I lanthipeptide [Pedobacter sp. MR2016-19]|uniref:class I lanthipeptide n=1 Tax=Pedobacter sp. MR2016-19 TaxID=2780089 RepID=UPI001875DE97|nr:class I lanthipeptide [Pedobacter sp. MR2016-19]MBE5320466.1 class I lanthipeptide [Pedobacter sp. MR2016-19]